MPNTIWGCRAFLLDMDGTLVDSTEAVKAQWGRWAARYGLQLEDILRISHGRPAIDTMRRLAPEAATEEELARFMQEEEDHEGGVKPIPGAVDFVRRLPAGSWAVVTSAPRSLALMRLAAAGYPTPGVLIAPEDVERGKPDPLPFLTAAQRLGIDAADCVVIEDAHAGIQAARAAGMRVIGITTTYTREQLGCEFTVPDFTRLHLDVEAGGLRLEIL